MKRFLKKIFPKIKIYSKKLDDFELLQNQS